MANVFCLNYSFLKSKFSFPRRRNALVRNLDPAEERLTFLAAVDTLSESNNAPEMVAIR